MCGRKLKNFDVYLQKIETYTKASKLRIEYKDTLSCGGEFTPYRRLITVEDNLPDSETLATLLHELGHSIDDSLFNQGVEQKVSRAYIAEYKDRSTPKQKKLVLDCENRAWAFGRSIAKRLKIPLGKWYDKVRAYNLKSYKKGKRK